LENIKPIVIVSECLGFEKCRYNAQIVPDRTIETLKEYVEFIPVCPEVEIGLGIPREPIRIVLEDDTLHLFQPATGQDVTQAMQDFTIKFLDGIKEVDGFILKNRSPSCGFNDVKIYQGYDKSAMSMRGHGFFGGAVIEKFGGLAIEDEGRLKNFAIREYFFTRLYTLARFRKVKNEGRMVDLVKFHTNHKYLLLAYNQTRYRNCGRITANHERYDTAKVFELYGDELKRTLAKAPRFTAIINTLLHAFGGVSKKMSAEERKFFLNRVEEYRDERIPLSVLVQLIHSYAVRFNSEFLLNQAFINPFPKELMEVSDSGKGRNY